MQTASQPDLDLAGNVVISPATSSGDGSLIIGKIAKVLRISLTFYHLRPALVLAKF